MKIRLGFILGCFCLLCLLPQELLGQSSAELKARREQLLEDIKNNTSRLNDTRRNKAAAIEQIALIQKQISNREELISTLQAEITHMESSIERSNEVVLALKEDAQSLEKEYSQLLRVAYRSKLRNSWLSFLLSSRSFNEAFRRWRYLRQYQRFRSRQAKLIAATQQTLESKLLLLEEKHDEKQVLLKKEQQQQQAISKEKNAKNRLLRRLKKSETGILAEIERQEKASAQLNSAIEKAIVEEMARVRKEEERRERAKQTSGKPSTVVKEDNNFASLKGQLPWPARGEIVRRFGRQEHPTVKGVEITNNGIDISVEEAVQVKSVAKGVVVSTHFVPGYRNMVLVRHGEYYTVYSNLESVEVKKGQSIRLGQILGMIGADSGNLHFEVWKQKERLNPQHWIK